MQSDDTTTESRGSLGFVLTALQRLEEAVLSFSVLAIAVLTITNVFARSVFNSSIAATEELCQFLIVVVTFVGLSYAVSQARHIRMTAVYDALDHRTRKILTLVISVSTCALMFFLAWHALQYVLIVRRLGSVSPVLQTPLYLVYLVAPLGLSLAGLRYAATTVRNLRDRNIWISYAVREHQEDPAP